MGAGISSADNSLRNRYPSLDAVSDSVYRCRTMQQNRALGVSAALGAFTLWGVLPLYWYLIREASAVEITLHRVAWGAVTAWVIVLLRRRRKANTLNDGNEPIVSLRPSWKIYSRLLPNGLLLVGNWSIYIWAVTHGHTLDASLGYYINPLVNVLLGLLLFGERLSVAQWVAVILATAGVVLQTNGLGYLPWISLALAFSFGIYGAVKKKTQLSSIHSLAVELTAVGPLALLVILVGLVFAGGADVGNAAYLARLPVGTFLNGSPLYTIVLLGAGIVTVLPLLLFGIAAQNIRLADVGFFQYIAPTLMLVIGVSVFHEPLDERRLPGFILVWIALVVYSLSNVVQRRR